MARKLHHAEMYADQNLMAASIISADPAQYPPGSLMATWADLLTTRAAEEKDADVGPLFSKAA